MWLILDVSNNEYTALPATPPKFCIKKLLQNKQIYLTHTHKLPEQKGYHIRR